jgi:hypothetical protein
MAVIPNPRVDQDTFQFSVPGISSENPHIPTFAISAALTAPKDLQVRLPHVVRYLAKGLTDIVGPSDAESTAVNLLAVTALSNATEAGRTQLLTTLCTRVPTRLRQYLVTNTSGDRTQATHIDEYFLGPFNPEKFVYETERAGSSHWKTQASARAGNFCIVRSIAVETLPLRTTRIGQHPADVELLHGLLDNIYSAIADRMWVNFWEGLREAQLLETALRTSYVDIDSFRMMSVHTGGALWTIFSRIGGSSMGWVSPKMGGLAMQLPSPLAYSDLRRIIRSELGFSGWNESEISRTLKSFCLMLWRAKSYQVSISFGPAERVDGAFLHYMIALEILFNEREATTNAVVRRTAVVTHQALGLSFRDLKEEADRLYEARSRFVHQGRSVSETELRSAVTLTETATEWLLGLASTSPIDRKWAAVLKEIDLVAATLDAGRKPLDELVNSLAIRSASKIPHTLLSDRSGQNNDS